MPAAAVIGAQVVGGVLASRAQKDAARTAAEAEKYAADLQMQMFDKARQDQLPLIQARNQALPLFMQLLGIKSPQYATNTNTSDVRAPIYGTTKPPEWAGRKIINTDGSVGDEMQRDYVLNEQIMNETQQSPQMMQSAGPIDLNALIAATPGYQFRLSEGQKAAERSAAARGSLASGATLKALARYGEGLAAQEYGDFANRLASIIGLGQTAATTSGQFGQNAAQGAGQHYANIGGIRGSAYANNANIWGNVLGQSANALGNYWANKSGSTSFNPNGNVA